MNAMETALAAAIEAGERAAAIRGEVFGIEQSKTLEEFAAKPPWPQTGRVRSFPHSGPRSDYEEHNNLFRASRGC